MFLTAWRFFTILLAALLMGATFGHVLEMPQKMGVDGPLWVTYQHTLYRYFALVGGPIEIGAILAAAVLAYLVRQRRPALALTLTAAVLLAISFLGVWLGVVWPVNNQTATWTAEALPADWTRWRARWEYGHLAHFALHLSGFCALVLSVLLEIPNPEPQDDRATRFGGTHGEPAHASTDRDA